jgi:hypothetical protein
MIGLEIGLLIILAYAYYLIRQSDKKINKTFELAENMRVMWHEENIAHQKTKAELEQYKNHQENTYKLLSSQAKVSTSGGGMGDYAILAVDEFSVVNEARYTFAIRGEQYIGYGLPDNKIKALPMTPTVSTPEIPLETIYITFG